MIREIQQIGVRGLRSFGYEEQPIPFKKINLYIGKNSCGKSTFLRTFPLLRQSVDSQARYPILWYAGPTGLVDFGNYNAALNDAGETIHFDFDLLLNPRLTIAYFTAQRFHTIERNFEQDYFTCRFSLSLNQRKNVTESKITLSCEGTSIEICYQEDTVTSVKAVNKKYNLHQNFTAPLQLTKGSLIPTSIHQKKDVTIKKYYRRTEEINSIAIEAANGLAEHLKKHHHQSKQIENIKEALSLIEICPKSKIIGSLSEVFNKDKYFLKKLKNENESDSIQEISFTYLLIKNINYFLEAADDTIKNFYRGVRYLGPVRASAERYYRHQDLQIEEVDHTGSNLPMVINSLIDTQKRDLSIWIKDNFGFEINLVQEGNHYALLVREDEDINFHNVSDMGFGYSQILPVLVSIWLELNQKPEESTWFPGRAQVRTIVIEQPELHLHPALQFKFGLAIAKAIQLAHKQDKHYNFVIETHSKHIVDAIGECIANNITNADDVNIALFEKSSKGLTNVSLSGYDKDGYLMNWPAGFLSA